MAVPEYPLPSEIHFKLVHNLHDLEYFCHLVLVWYVVSSMEDVCEAPHDPPCDSHCWSPGCRWPQGRGQMSRSTCYPPHGKSPRTRAPDARDRRCLLIQKMSLVQDIWQQTRQSISIKSVLWMLNAVFLKTVQRHLEWAEDSVKKSQIHITDRRTEWLPDSWATVIV